MSEKNNPQPSRPALKTSSARCELVMNPRMLATIKAGKLPKGDLWPVAQVAGVLGSKKVSELIPLSYPAFVKNVELKGSFGKKGIIIESKVCYAGSVSADLEALTSAAIAALSIIDMCKSVQKGIEIRSLKLTHLPLIRPKKHKH